MEIIFNVLIFFQLNSLIAMWAMFCSWNIFSVIVKIQILSRSDISIDIQALDLLGLLSYKNRFILNNQYVICFFFKFISRYKIDQLNTNVHFRCEYFLYIIYRRHSSRFGCSNCEHLLLYWCINNTYSTLDSEFKNFCKIHVVFTSKKGNDHCNCNCNYRNLYRKH